MIAEWVSDYSGGLTSVDIQRTGLVLPTSYRGWTTWLAEERLASDRLLLLVLQGYTAADNRLQAEIRPLNETASGTKVGLLPDGGRPRSFSCAIGDQEDSV